MDDLTDRDLVSDISDALTTASDAIEARGYERDYYIVQMGYTVSESHDDDPEIAFRNALDSLRQNKHDVSEYFDGEVMADLFDPGDEDAFEAAVNEMYSLVTARLRICDTDPEEEREGLLHIIYRVDTHGDYFFLDSGAPYTRFFGEEVKTILEDEGFDVVTAGSEPGV